MIRLDKNGRELKNGDVIDLHQTVNGQNLFVIFQTSPLDIRYGHNVNRKYEYDKEALLKPCKYTGETEYEIVSNIYCTMLGIAFFKTQPK